MWSNLKALKAHFVTLSDQRWPRSFVAISVHSAELGTDLSAFNNLRSDDPTPAPVDDTWSLVGFDVADAGLTSGLSNCGRHPAETESLRARWGPLLNANHLFRSVEVADEFKSHCNATILGHAPFFVFGLWLV